MSAVALQLAGLSGVKDERPDAIIEGIAQKTLRALANGILHGESPQPISAIELLEGIQRAFAHDWNPSQFEPIG